MAGLFDDDDPAYSPEDFQLGSMNASDPGIGTAAQVPTPAPSSNWLSDIGLLLSSTAGGARGDFSVVERALANRQRMQLAEKQQKMDEDKLTLSRHETTLHAFKMAKDLSDLIDGDPEKAKKAAGILGPIFETTGGKFDQKDIADLMTRPDSWDALSKYYDALRRTGGFTPQLKKAFKEGKISLKDANAAAEEALGEAAFNRLLQIRNETIDINGNKVAAKDLSYADALGKDPDIKYITDNQLSRLNQAGFSGFKTKSVLEAEAKGKIESAASQAATARFLEGQDRADARSEKNQDRIDERQRRTLDPILQSLRSQARVEGTERGLQNTLTARLDRIQKEAEAATGGKPLDTTTRESVSQLLNLRNQAAVVQENYKEDFLGPVKGTAAAFEARRRVGTYIGTPLGQAETTFRQALNDVQATITYALSGKQINEGEAKRLRGMLPAATDEPQVFQAGMRRFDNEAASIIESKVKLGKTPRRNLSNTAPAPNTKPSGTPSPQRIEELKKKYGIQ